MEKNNILKVRAKVLHPKDVLCINSQCQDGEWVYGELHLQAHVPHIHLDIRRKEPIDVTTIGRFTGMCDKNGIEIYEGDICEINDFTSVYSSPYKGKVVFVKGSWCVYYESRLFGAIYKSLYFDDFASKKTKVIGNIYDNPRKLKKI